MARNAIESEFRTTKMADRSEMAINAIERDFRTFKMAAEKKILYRSEMARIAIESEFQTSKMADRSEMARNSPWAQRDYHNLPGSSMSGIILFRCLSSI